MSILSMKRPLSAIVLTGLVMLSACNKKPEKADTPDNRPPATVAPLGFARENTDAQVSLTLPDTVKLYPDLHTRLYKEGEATLTAFMKQAHADRAEIAATGFPQPPYSHSIVWKLAAQTPRLVSMFAEEDDYQGGAHPNHTYQTVLWDRASQSLIPSGHLFVPGADFKAINSFVCSQIEAARSKRAGTPVSQGGSGFSCPKFDESRLVLMPSNQPDKIGAIDALYAPYDVGAYAEGPYEIRVPQSLIRGLLAPEFADQFGGEATPAMALPDPTVMP
ncbi:MAG: DUF4163 domain-containing protein [Asticcacaulis sp.]